MTILSLDRDRRSGDRTSTLGTWSPPSAGKAPAADVWHEPRDHGRRGQAHGGAGCSWGSLPRHTLAWNCQVKWFALFITGPVGRSMVTMRGSSPPTSLPTLASTSPGTVRPGTGRGTTTSRAGHYRHTIQQLKEQFHDLYNLQDGRCDQRDGPQTRDG